MKLKEEGTKTSVFVPSYVLSNMYLTGGIWNLGSSLRAKSRCGDILVFFALLAEKTQERSADGIA